MIDVVPFITKIAELINNNLSPEPYIHTVKSAHALILFTKDAFLSYSHTVLPSLVAALDNRTSDEKTTRITH